MRPEDDELEQIIEDLKELESAADTLEERETIRRMKRIAGVASQPPLLFGRVVKGFGKRDVSEAFVGSLLFGVPMAVEDGTLAAGMFTAQHPPLFFATFFSAILLVTSILYATKIQDVQIVNPVFGIIPRRLIGVTGAAFFTAVVLMTVWGRVDWATPWIALNQVTIAFFFMGIGASLGDILPGT